MTLHVFPSHKFSLRTYKAIRQYLAHILAA